MRETRFNLLLSTTILASALLCACGSSTAVSGGSTSTPPVALDRSCDLAPFPSAQWTQCEAQNYAKAGEAPLEQISNPVFQSRLAAQSQTNLASLLERDTADPSWLLTSNPALPWAATYAFLFAGDPFRWPEASGPDGDQFYRNEAVVTPVVFYDSGCARLSGRVWRPKNVAAGRTLPGVVITNGSLGGPEPTYWWAAQALVRAGYMVLSYDPRGQGRSDFVTPTGGLGTNANAEVFWINQVDAIDFLHSTPTKLYPNNVSCAGTYPTPVAPYNPEYALLDPARLGIAGHSYGAIGVSVVQGYDAPGADPWPG
ncbi:MAG: alpha/beta hydrolase family protein, partial [Solimonas sp.]